MKNKSTQLLFIILLYTVPLCAQTNLPLKEWPGSDTKKSFVFYISGDGGMNSFSTPVCKTISSNGFTVAALDAKSYFWDKKTAAEAASDIGFYLQKASAGYSTIVFVGYSFGADVLPFIINQLPVALHKKISSVVLLSPSGTTDFEIHWSDMLGFAKKRKMDVVAEMNQLNLPKTTALFGSDEMEFPVKKVTLPNFKAYYLPGGHHFEGNTNEVANMIIHYF